MLHTEPIGPYSSSETVYQLPIERNFEYLEKNGVLQFLDRLAGPDDNAVHALTNNGAQMAKMLRYVTDVWTDIGTHGQRDVTFEILF